MIVHRSYTCRIVANPGKEDFIKSALLELKALSEHVFSLGKERWADQNTLYAECRKKFPTLNSKQLQNFIREYKPAGKRKAPKDHAIPAAIFVDQKFKLNYSDETEYTNWWLRFNRINFPLRGKKNLERLQNGGTPVHIRVSEKNGKIWCKIVTKLTVQEKTKIDPENSTGLDVNTACLATSDNTFYSTKRMLHAQQEHRKNKMKHRNLANHTRDFVHKLTTRIADDLVSKGRDVLVLEDLTGLRRSKSRKLGTSYKRGVNHTVNSMPYYMFRNFLTYKCSLRGIKVVTISPEYTSMTCNVCGSRKTKRPKQDSFVCLDCDHQIHADLNAARNIRLRYTSANGLLLSPTPVSEITENTSTIYGL